MQEIIGDLKDLAGVLGACLYHSQKGILGTNLPTIFTTEKLLELGKLLKKIHSAGRMNFHDITDLSLQYDESVILVRELEENLIIFLFCDPGFNQNLVSMSLNLVQQELKNQPLLQPAPITQESPATTTEDVQKILLEMRTHLPKIMGPMADMIFEETVEAWQQEGRCTIADLDSLVKLLAEEIGSAEKISRYKEMIAPALTQTVKGQ